MHYDHTSTSGPLGLHEGAQLCSTARDAIFDNLSCTPSTYDTTLSFVSLLPSQAPLTMSRGPLTALPYNNSKGENPVEACGPPCTQIAEIPILHIFPCNFPQHCLEGPIKSFDQSICLWVIWTGPDWVYVQRSINFTQQLKCENTALISQDFFGYPDPSEIRTSSSARHSASMLRTARASGYLVA